LENSAGAISIDECQEFNQKEETSKKGKKELRQGLQEAMAKFSIVPNLDINYPLT